MMLATVVGTVLSGFTTKLIGYYNQYAILGTCIASVGAGLLTTFQVDTPQAKWIGFQVVYGFGYGLCYQVPNLAIQAILPKRDAPMGFALCLFGGLLVSSVALAVGENILANQLVDGLSEFPGFDRDMVTSGSVLSLLDSLPDDLRQRGLFVYNEALRKVFQVGLVITCFSVLGAFPLSWQKIKTEEKKGDIEADGANKGEKGEDVKDSDVKDGEAKSGEVKN
jgi:MFS family permease